MRHHMQGPRRHGFTWHKQDLIRTVRRQKRALCGLVKVNAVEIPRFAVSLRYGSPRRVKRKQDDSEQPKACFFEKSAKKLLLDGGMCGALPQPPEN
jgi:hypothetical protein